MEEILQIIQNFRPDISMDTDGLISEDILDSIDVVFLVNALSENYDIKIQTQDISPANFDSIEKVFNYIKSFHSY